MTQKIQSDIINFPPDNWVETTLGEVCILNYGKGLITENRIFGNIPVYGSSGITGWHNEALINEKGLIIGRKGSVGTIYKSEIPFYPIDTVYYITQKDTKCDLEFLYKLLKSLGLNKKNSDSAVPGLNRENAYSTEISIPPLTEQKAIASVLSSFDDKIELLREQNKTLEKMGQTIFQEWFGKYNIDSKLPDGWRVGKLGEVVDFIIDNRGKTPPIIENSNNSIPLIEVNAIVGNSRIIDINQCKKFVDQENYNSWFRKGHPQNGDVLISTVGSIGQLAQVFEEKICIAQNIVALRFSNYGNFLYESLKSIQNEIISIDISSVQPSIKVPHLLNIEIVIPPKETIEEFEKTISPITKKISDNNSQIQSLARSRDELLPKLMSGMVRVNDFSNN